MKNVILLLLLTCLTASGVWSRSVADCFKDMPAHLLPGLNPAMRLDLVDFFSSGKTARLLGILGAEMELKIMTEDYLMLQTSAVSNVQLKLLPLKNGNQLLAVVNTVKAPAASSDLAFYSLDWKPVDTLTKPDLAAAYFFNKDCLQQKSAGQDLSIEELCSMYFYEYNFQSGNNFLLVYSSLPDFLGEEAFAGYRDCFNQRLVLEWTEKGFVY
ncbi:MAG: DUF3256 family protein [Bacteroidales bacterium]|nr:DUF3256 family protein [Bacteroidales bacterium]MDD4362569.1 DUF3256 family protein [Bacteroidales bacterium]